MIKQKDLPPPSEWYPVKRALLSVSDKSGLIPLAQGLADMGVELLSTGGTARALREAGVPVTNVSDVTQFPEILDGRVKTLHPNIHGGLLARKTDPDDLNELENYGIAPIDLVVVNLYPFQQAIQGDDVTDALAIENIDIGGPTMIRAAAKNFFFVGVVTEPADYELILTEMQQNAQQLCLTTRRMLAQKAFTHTGQYDTAIARYFDQEAAGSSATLTISAPKVQTLRYGENPHQKASLFGDTAPYFSKLHGKDLSFNNLIDLSAALYLINEFKDAPPTCAILKHTNPCGVATADSLVNAYHQAFATDKQSPFGGIVVVNRPLDIATAEAIDAIFTELIIAPDFESDVLDFLMAKKNRRLIQSHQADDMDNTPDLRSIAGGYLVQDRDSALPPAAKLKEQVKVVTRRQPTDAEWADLDFAWRVAKHVKSNAIVYAKNRSTIGIGAGQMSRVDASEIAVNKGAKSELDFGQSVVASDAFFPFADGLIAAATSGARAAIQPGGSIRDQEVIDAADDHNMAMVFTGNRHFRH